MMKLKLFSGNLAKLVLSLLSAFFLCSCSLETSTPTYKCKTLAESLTQPCQKEYQLTVKSRVVGKTLWLYFPSTQEFFTKSDRSSFKNFEIITLEGGFADRNFDFNFFIKKKPRTKEPQMMDYTKEIRKTLNDLLMCQSRLMLSSNCGIDFLVVAVADIINGQELVFTTYVKDLKKYTYSTLSMSDFSLRRIFEFRQDEKIKNDTEGTHINFVDIKMSDYLTKQIKQRIEANFQGENTSIKESEIESEILKIIANCLKNYDFKDFSWVELRNLHAKKRLMLNRKGLEDFINLK